MYSSSSSSGELIASAFGAFAFIWIIGVIAGIITLIAEWKMLEKAGEPGWKILIPFYNIYIVTKVAGLPGWFMIVPFLFGIGTLVWSIVVMINLAKAFGQSTAFAIGLIFLTPILLCILGFGNAQYQLGNNAAAAAPAADGSTPAQPAAPVPKPEVGDDWVNGQQ